MPTNNRANKENWGNASLYIMFHGIHNKSLLLVLILLPAIPHFFNDIFQLFGFAPWESYKGLSGKDIFWLFDFVTYFLMPCGVIYFYFRKGWLRWVDFDFLWIKPWLNIGIGFLLAAGLWILFFLKIIYINKYLHAIYPSTHSIGGYIYTSEDGVIRYAILSVYLAVSAAILEEAIYRSFLIRGFERLGLSTLSAACIAVLIFILAHFASGATFMFNAVLSGVFFSIIYVKTRNIFPLVVAHFLLDFSSGAGFDYVLFRVLMPIFA